MRLRKALLPKEESSEASETEVCITLPYRIQHRNLLNKGSLSLYYFS